MGDPASVDDGVEETKDEESLMGAVGTVDLKEPVWNAYFALSRKQANQVSGQGTSGLKAKAHRTAEVLAVKGKTGQGDTIAWYPVESAADLSWGVCPHNVLTKFGK